jgi:hypothetical protein
MVQKRIKPGQVGYIDSFLSEEDKQELRDEKIKHDIEGDNE